MAEKEGHGRHFRKSAAEREAIAGRLREARKSSGLSQVTLAKRLGRSQSFVSQAETGAVVVGDQYVQSVLAACKLEPTWGAPPKVEEKPRSGWDLLPHEIAGLDPATWEPVGKNTPRDIELAGLYQWWKDKRDERVAIETARAEAGMEPMTTLY